MRGACVKEEIRKQRNIGIFAHVDAGKTTLSEQLLLKCGAIRQAGSVDRGTAHTDDLPVEQRRGISVRASCVSMKWKDTEIRLIDTPGHVDFSAEVERSLWALDAAVLVVCAVQGVQPHTEALFAALQEQQIPVLIFLNKTDREGANPARVLSQIHRRLSTQAVLLSETDALLECVCAQEDALLERYLLGESIAQEEITQRLPDLVAQGKVYPVLTGSALRGEGIEQLLDAIVSLLPPPGDAGALSGVVFALAQDKLLGRGVWVRLYGGKLENREALTLPAGMDPLTGEERLVQRKITQIRHVDGSDAGYLGAGEIGVVYGLGSVKVGFVFGQEEQLPRRVEPGRLRAPLIAVQVVPDNPEDMTALRAACEQLSAEDPLLQAHYSRSLNELQLHAMGAIQLEILLETLKTRFGLNASFSPPAVLYRETIRHKSVGFCAYTMPKPCWAILHFDIEPAPRGSGVTFRSTVPVKDIMARYQHQVEQALPLALHQGRLGWPVTDVNITLSGGEHHLVHTHPLDFIVATPWAIQDGLKNGEPQLLEPVLEIRFSLPPDCVGRIMSDVAQMRGEVVDTLADEDRVLLTAHVPVATSLDYAQTLSSITSGRGSMSVRLHGYQDCPMELGRTCQRRSVDPLDTAKYILAARSALEGGIFDLD